MSKRVTIKDVAKMTKLSVGTISNYINGKTVSHKNQELIAEAIKELGFRVNNFARGLRTASSKTVAMLTPDFDTYYLSAIISATEKLLMRKGYSIHISDYYNDLDALKERLAYILEENVDGLIFLPRMTLNDDVAKLLSEYRTMSIPVILMSEVIPGVEADSITADYEKAIYNACNSFIAKGHSKICLLSSSRPYAFSKRTLGYKRAFEEHRLPVDEELFCTTQPDKTNAFNGFMELLQRRPDITAVVTGGYKLTLGALEAIVSCGKTVGKEISIIGTDCEDIAGICTNKLSYIDVSVNETAECLVDLLMRRIRKDETGFPAQIMLNTKFVEGNSIASLK